MGAEGTTTERAEAVLRHGYEEHLRQFVDASRGGPTEAGERGVAAVLTKWFPIYPPGEKSPDEWKFFWQGYTKAVGHFSVTTLEAAMERWAADPAGHRFLPKPGELRALCASTPTDSLRLVHDARTVLSEVENVKRKAELDADMAQRGTSAKEQAERVRQLLGTYTAESAEKRARMERAAKQGIPHADRMVLPPGDPESWSPAQRDMVSKARALGFEPRRI